MVKYKAFSNEVAKTHKLCTDMRMLHPWITMLLYSAADVYHAEISRYCKLGRAVNCISLFECPYSWERNLIQSISSCPLEVIGVAELVNKINGPGFNRFDEDLATAFSIYCGISIAHVSHCPLWMTMLVCFISLVKQYMMQFKKKKKSLYRLLSAS